jgi:tetratricopeptide (TPR) repeat protein
MQIGDYDLALADANRAILLSPDEFGYYLRGDIYRDQGQFAEAVEDYSRAIRLNPKDPDYLERRATAYELLEKPDEARADRETAQLLANKPQTSARTVEAIDFIVYLAKAGIRLRPTSSGGLDIVGGRLKSETMAKLGDLTPELVDLLQPGNDRGAALILLAWLRAQNVELEAIGSDEMRVTRGKISRENQAELDRLKPQVAQLLAEGNP